MYYEVGWNRTQKLIWLNKWLHICYKSNTNSLASSLFIRVSMTILCIISYIILLYIHNRIISILILFQGTFWYLKYKSDLHNKNPQGQDTTNIIIIKDYFYKVIWNCPKMFYSFFDLSPSFEIITKWNHLSFII